MIPQELFWQDLCSRSNCRW